MERSIETKLRLFFPREGELSDATQNNIFNRWQLESYVWANFEEMTFLLENRERLMKLIFHYELPRFSKSFDFHVTELRQVEDVFLTDSERLVYATKGRFKLTYLMKELKVAVAVPRGSIGNKN